MKLIREEIENVEVIVEQRDGKKNLYIEGIFLQTEQPNRNRRIYSMPTMEREVKRYNEAFVQKGRALGELGHPDGPTVNLDRVSHKIVSLQREGNNFIGKAKILSTPMGKIAESLLSEGVKLGVSSRGVGTLSPTKEGYNQVNDELMESWKEKTGFGMVAFSAKKWQRKHINKSILSLIPKVWKRASLPCSRISSQTFKL
jgi:hypothetical protein